MTEQCAFCGNKHLTPKTTRYLHQHDEQLLIVEGVPCLECDFCGEQYFEIDVLKRIEADHREIAEHRREPARYVSVAVEAFDSVR
ncbi:YgiT-type zinc finger protein [Nitrosomonas communis]|jgi:YgiT-type zinc finger domain-containing protein|uniref:YgiT-type zinc finger protein n=1 Tax=Nitrosomonas communis TaxID=44574 RepID=UPI0026E9C766|nr:YgiT-type zinc finger protein [Nitrosomonas communis]MCO6426961.1 YgiT-type zinc finger protein [Nitrosomonas communis]